LLKQEFQLLAWVVKLNQEFLAMKNQSRGFFLATLYRLQLPEGPFVVTAIKTRISQHFQEGMASLLYKKR
jgi:hypothetical protein